MMSSPYHTLQKVRIYYLLMMLEINSLFNLGIKDLMFITSTTENSKGCFTAKFDRNWA